MSYFGTWFIVLLFSMAAEARLATYEKSEINFNQIIEKTEKRQKKIARNLYKKKNRSKLKKRIVKAREEPKAPKSEVKVELIAREPRAPAAKP